MLIKSSGQTSLKQYGRSLNTAGAMHGAMHGANNGQSISEAACRAACDAEPTCVGFFLYHTDGTCNVFGPAVAQGARSPWIAHPSSTMTIWGASGDSAYVCVAVVGRN